MKLKEFSDNLIKLLKKRPETAEFDVVTSKDDEGNGYNPVYFEPSVGRYNKEDDEFEEEIKPNAICVN